MELGTILPGFFGFSSCEREEEHALDWVEVSPSLGTQQYSNDMLSLPSNLVRESLEKIRLEPASLLLICLYTVWENVAIYIQTACAYLQHICSNLSGYIYIKIQIHIHIHRGIWNKAYFGPVN